MSSINAQNISSKLGNWCPSRTTVFATGALLTAWWIIDPKNIIEKVLTAALGAIFGERVSEYIRSEAIKRGSPELDRWQKSYEAFMGSKEELSLRTKTYADLSNEAYERGQQTWSTANQYRIPVRAGARKAVEEITHQHLTNHSKLLEIGSNTLDSEGRSHLACLLPDAHLAHLTYSDYIPFIVKQEMHKTKRAYKHLDIRNPKKKNFNSQDCLIAINVADILAHQDLPKMAKGAYQLLKKDGKVIILADRPIDLAAISHLFSDPDNFAFPMTKELHVSNASATLVQGVNVIAIDSLRKIIQSWGSQYQSFFKNLMGLNPAQRQFFLQKSFFEGMKLCQFLQVITNNECQTYDKTESYQNEVISAFKSHRFECLFSGYKEGLALIDHPDPESMPYNKIIFDPRYGGPLASTSDPEVALRKLQVSAHFHVMVFKKLD